jgi:hypothetical protein
MKSGMNGSLVARLRKFWFPTLASALLAIPTWACGSCSEPIGPMPLV